MIRDILVLGTVWGGVACWFAHVGFLLLARGPHHDRVSWPDSVDSIWRFRSGIIGLIGAGLVVTHILASYAYEYGWNHAAAVAATAEQSRRVTGVAAGWGVYVNFAFVGVWCVVSGWLVRAGAQSDRPGETLIRPGDAFENNGLRRRFLGVYLGFSVLIVFSATVVFESGGIRWVGLAGFAGLAVIAFRTHRRDQANRSSGG